MEEKVRNVKRFRNYRKNENALKYWYKTRNPLRIVANFCILELARYSPSLAVKNSIYRMLGMHIGRNARIALKVNVGIFYPELISIGENSLVGFNSLILEHEFLQEEYRFGKVYIGKNVMIGAQCLILPGVTIGDDAVVGAGSVVTKDVPAGAFVAGVPARMMKRNNFKK